MPVGCSNLEVSAVSCPGYMGDKETRGNHCQVLPHVLRFPGTPLFPTVEYSPSCVCCVRSRVILFVRGIPGRNGATLSWLEPEIP